MNKNAGSHCGPAFLCNPLPCNPDFMAGVLNIERSNEQYSIWKIKVILCVHSEYIERSVLAQSVYRETSNSLNRGTRSEPDAKLAL